MVVMLENLSLKTVKSFYITDVLETITRNGEFTIFLKGGGFITLPITKSLHIWMPPPEIDLSSRTVIKNPTVEKLNKALKLDEL